MVFRGNYSAPGDKERYGENTARGFDAPRGHPRAGVGLLTPSAPDTERTSMLTRFRRMLSPASRAVTVVALTAGLAVTGPVAAAAEPLPDNQMPRSSGSSEELQFRELTEDEAFIAERDHVLGGAELPYTSPDNPWRTWDEKKLIPIYDPRFFDPKENEGKIVSPHGTEGVVCAQARWALTACYQHGKKLIHLDTGTINGTFVNFDMPKEQVRRTAQAFLRSSEFATSSNSPFY